MLRSFRRVMVTVALLAAFAVGVSAKPAEAHDGCHTRKCKARVAHRACDQKHPRACVLHVIYHQRITGWRRAWLLRVPGCESGWNPLAYFPSQVADTAAERRLVIAEDRSAGVYAFKPSTWADTPYGNRSIWSAFWQPYAAAYMLRVGRAGEWVCG